MDANSNPWNALNIGVQTGLDSFGRLRALKAERAKEGQESKLRDAQLAKLAQESEPAYADDMLPGAPRVNLNTPAGRAGLSSWSQVNQQNKDALKEKAVPAEFLSNLSASASALRQLDTMDKFVQSDPGMFGPTNIASGLNPYDSKRRIYNAQAAMATQLVGKYLEGGKMTDPDIARYAKLFSVSETPETAKSNLANLRRAIQQKYNADLDGARRAGYAVGKFKPYEVSENAMEPGGLSAPKAPPAAAAAPPTPAEISEARQAANDPLAPPEIKAEAQKVLRLAGELK